MKSMHKGYCVIGSGYLGLITAAQMEKTDHQLTITTRSYPKSEQLAGIGSYLVCSSWAMVMRIWIGC